LAILLDSSVLMRFVNATDPQHAIALRAIRALHQGGSVLHVAPQILIEFRNAATRPASANGIGLAPNAADKQIEAFERVFPLLLEPPDVYPAWKRLVAASAVIGKQVHDARIVAVCQIHHFGQILTFNVRRFARFAAFAPGLIIIDPASL
jgi:predicted nucleic acid-binding protein